MLLASPVHAGGATARGVCCIAGPTCCPHNTSIGGAWSTLPVCFHHLSQTPQCPSHSLPKPSLCPSSPSSASSSATASASGIRREWRYGSLAKASPPRNLASISTASANSSGHLLAVHLHQRSGAVHHQLPGASQPRVAPPDGLAGLYCLSEYPTRLETAYHPIYALGREGVVPSSDRSTRSFSRPQRGYCSLTARTLSTTSSNT